MKRISIRVLLSCAVLLVCTCLVLSLLSLAWAGLLVWG